MSLAIAAALMALFSVLLLGPISASLSRASWVQRAPRAGVLLWQCMGVGAVFSGIGAGLALAVTRYHAGFLGGVAELAEGIARGRPLQGLGLYDALALTLAADLLIVLSACFAVVTRRVVRSRARHRTLLDLVAYESPEYPGTELLEDERAIAYCLPGLRPRIVLSDGTLTLLPPHELMAVIEHERAHAHERHGLVMLPMAGLTSLLGWIPYARRAPLEVALLLEMAADDYAARRATRRSLAAALVHMSSGGWAPSCSLAAAGSDVVARVSRLLHPTSHRKHSAALAAGLGIGVVLFPVCIALLA
jgi:Zn-dependent protease with chaperone function